jgi:hypothetical protein
MAGSSRSLGVYAERSVYSRTARAGLSAPSASSIVRVAAQRGMDDDPSGQPEHFREFECSALRLRSARPPLRIWGQAIHLGAKKGNAGAASRPRIF